MKNESSSIEKIGVSEPLLDVLPDCAPKLITYSVPIGEKNAPNDVEILKHTKLNYSQFPCKVYYAVSDKEKILDRFGQIAIQYLRGVEPYNRDSIIPTDTLLWIHSLSDAHDEISSNDLHLLESRNRGALYKKYTPSVLSSGIEWGDPDREQYGQYVKISGFSGLEILSKTSKLNEISSKEEIYAAVIGNGFNYDNGFYSHSAAKILFESLFEKDFKEHINSKNEAFDGLNIGGIGISPIYLTTHNGIVDLSKLFYDRKKSRLVIHPEVTRTINRLNPEDECCLSSAISYWSGELSPECNLDGIKRAIPLGYEEHFLPGDLDDPKEPPPIRLRLKQ